MPTAAQLSENSHQGFDGIRAALCLGSMPAKPNTASGMPVCLWREGTGSRSSGKERDAETGLDFFLARYYSGAQGRFLSPDEFKGGPDDALTGKDIAPPGPLPYADIANPQTLNKYAYVINNPLRYTDPDGHCAWDICIGEAIATAALVGYLVSPPGQKAMRDFVDATVVLTKAAGEAIGGLISKSETKPETKAADGSTTQAKPAGPKAANAPGVTAGGQATDQFGNKIAPSGEEQINKTKSNTREGARNKALNEGSGAVDHATPEKGKPHFHPTDKNGNKKPSSTHHEYPE